MKVLRVAVTMFVSFGIYLLMAGSIEPSELLLGAAVSVLVGFLTVRMPLFSPKILNPVRLLWAVAYLPYFLWKMLVANLRIAGIVLRPRLRISPSIVKGETELAASSGKLLLTNSITLTPGTLTVDARGRDLFVHCVNADERTVAGASRLILKPFERFLKRITG